MVKLGIIGCGNIGRFVMENLGREEYREFSLRLIADVPQAEPLLKELAATYQCDYSTEPLSMIDRGLDVVLEAANPEVVKKYAPSMLRAGINMLTMSVGAFADSQFFAEAQHAAREGGSRLLLPTGAIAGLDYCKSAMVAGVEEATLTMTKGPKGLAGAPYFDLHPVDLFALSEPTVVFEGTAAEAITGFPSNVNVAVALSLATLGPDRTRVKVICDPAATRIKVEIHVSAGSGELMVQVVNLPSPSNPKTSYQACCSALTTLRRFIDPVQLGT